MIPVKLKMYLNNVKFKQFWLAVAISNIALSIYVIAFSWLTVKHYGALGIAMTAFGYAIPNIMLVRFGGLVSDRFNKRMLYIIYLTLYILSGLILSVACVIETPSLWFLVGISVITGVISAFSAPTHKSIISGLVDASQIAATQQLFDLAVSLGFVIGPMLSSSILSLQDIYISNTNGAYAFLIYTCGMIPLILSIPKISLAPNLQDQIQAQTPTLKNGIKNIIDGFLYLYSDTRLKILMWLLSIVLIFGMPFTSLLSVFAHDHKTMLHTATFFSEISMCLGIGNLLGSLAGIGFTKIFKKTGVLFLLLIFGLCLSVVVAIEQANLLGIMLSIIFFGFFGTLIVNLLTDLIQSLTIETMRGRIAAFYQSAQGLQVMSAGLAGLIIHLLSQSNYPSYRAYELVELTMIALLVILALLSTRTIMKLNRTL